MTLAALLRDHPAASDAPLLHDLDQTLSASEVRERVAALADRIDIEPRQPVAVVAGGLDAVIAMFAVWEAGGVLVPVNPRLPAAALEETLGRVEPAAIVRSGSVEARASRRTHPDGTAFVMWTSGTTGDPKPISHAHEEYLEIIDRVLGPLSAGRDPAKRPSPNLIPVSLALNAGIYNVLFGMRAGAEIVVMDRFVTTDFATLVDRHAIRSTVLPPAAMVMLTDDDTIGDLSPLRYIRSITAPLSPFQARRFTARFGVTVLNGYGQAELGEVIGWTASDARDHPEKVGAAGRPHEGVSLRIDDPDRSGAGELLVRPPRPPAPTVAAMLADRTTDDGHVRTGDIARIDDDGFVWIEGRVGDLINRGGNKIVPSEVEEVLLSVPGVDEVAVVGVPDDRLGEVPVAVVVGDAADTAMEAACRDALAAYKVPVAFRHRPALPRNEAGKVLRQELS